MAKLFSDSGNYRIKEVIGEGSFGIVHRVVTSQGEVFALKLIDAVSIKNKKYSVIIKGGIYLSGIRVETYN